MFIEITLEKVACFERSAGYCHLRLFHFGFHLVFFVCLFSILEMLSQCASASLALMAGSDHKSDDQVNFVARAYAKAAEQTETEGTV